MGGGQPGSAPGGAISEALSIAAPADQPEQKKAKPSPEQHQRGALEALEAGNLSELEQMVMAFS